jgi:hypothetical protein
MQWLIGARLASFSTYSKLDFIIDQSTSNARGKIIKD